MKDTMLHQENNISPEDLDLIKIFDTADEVVAYIKNFYTNNLLQPNF